MKNHVCSVFVAVLLLFSAAEVNAAGVGSGWGKITQLHIRANGTVLMFRFSQPIVNPTVCEGGEFYIRELNDTPAKYLGSE